jgi:hypothetical protein
LPLASVATSNDHHHSYYLTASYSRRVTRQEIPLSRAKLDSGGGGDTANIEVNRMTQERRSLLCHRVVLKFAFTVNSL